MIDRPASPQFTVPELITLSAGQTQQFAEIQATLLTTMQEINRHWLGHLQARTTLATDLALHLVTAHSIPEVAGFWQDWANRRMELAAEETRNLYTDAQALAATCMQALPGNGGRDKASA